MKPATTALRRLMRLLAVALALLLCYQLWILAHVWWWRDHNPASTRFMRLQLAELREQQAEVVPKHQWVAYEQISEHLKRAVVAAEDDHFMTHRGFDWAGMQRALERNRAAGGAVAGGSTISQQLAKNLFLSPSRSYVRKGQEAVITVMIESLWPKRRILEVYLNVVEWGEAIYGAEAASQHYHGLSADRLGPAEASRLAVRLPNPRGYQHRLPAGVAAHAERVRARMGRSQIP
ncbi:MAG: monofunctional biosynthetic peptidoglycan transglycosylase [Rhodocyclaceae bacterium]